MVPRRPQLCWNYECSGCLELSIVLQKLDSYPPNTAQLLLKTWHLSTNPKCSFFHLNYINWIFLAFLVLFAFREVYFPKIKGRETFSRSHSNLYITDNNEGLTESFSAPTEQCYIHAWKKIKFFVFKISFAFFLL
jgi:hypothetical protein